MEATIHTINHIISNPKIRGGRPIIANTSIRVMDIVAMSVHHHKTDDEIAENYSVTLAQIHSALAYYYDHQTEIDEMIRVDAEQFEQLKVENGGNSLLP